MKMLEKYKINTGKAVIQGVSEVMSYLTCAFLK
jgi:hypothetical protein